MANQEVDWAGVREQFPAAEKHTYLNAAEASPISRTAAAEAKRFYDEMLADGDLHWETWLFRKGLVREKLADFIHADPGELAFTLNTSHGMNLVADILRGPGTVVTMTDEFPSSTLPWLHRKRDVHFVEPTEENTYSLEAIDKAIDVGARVLVTSYVQYRTGFRQDLTALGELCRARDVVFVVNGTQAVGAMPLDVEASHIDFLVFASLKWPLAGYGIGALYINKVRRDLIEYPVAGWQSVSHPDAMDNESLALKTDAAALEVGCPHFPNIFALGGALDLLNAIGLENVTARIFELDDYLVEKLTAIDVEIVSPLEKKYRSGITVLDIPNAAEIVTKLRERNVIVTERAGRLRVSLHVYNNEEDIDTFVAALGELLRRPTA